MELIDPNSSTRTLAQSPEDNTALPRAIPATTQRYQLEEEFARGGMGVVWRATDTLLGREVAIKFMLHGGNDRESRARFLQEIRITGLLQHPAITPVHDTDFLPDGRPFLVMKLVVGATLAELFNSRDDKLRDRGRDLSIFEQVCQALAYAHSRNVIHRDLKPHNVMLGGFGEVQVMDWGLAKVLKPDSGKPEAGATDETRTLAPSDSDDVEQTRAGSILGSPAFMAPEQALGAIDEIDYRSDVFGLGGILCVILTGRPPFLGTDAESTRLLAARGKLEDCFARLDACGAEPEIVDLCKRCLSVERSKRPADARTVAAAVARFRAESEERARRAETDRAVAESRTREVQKRRRVQTALAAAVGLLVLGLVSVAWWRDRAEAVQRTEAARQEAERDASATAAIELSTRLRDQYRFEEALAALGQPEGPGVSTSIRERLKASRDDVEFARELDHIQVSRLENPSASAAASARSRYRSEFRRRGIDPFEADLATMVDRIGHSSIRHPLIVALDDWAWLEPEPADAERLFSVSRSLDPGKWPNLLRNGTSQFDPLLMDRLAAELDLDSLPAHQLVHFFKARPKKWIGASQVIARAASRHPDNFWLLFEAGYYYYGKEINPALAATYLRASNAIRPGIFFVQRALVSMLIRSGQQLEALETARDLVRRHPANPTARAELASALANVQDFDAALAKFREALELAKDDGLVHADWQDWVAYLLIEKGDGAAALPHARESVRLAPDSSQARYNLARAILLTTDDDEAIVHLREAVRLTPEDKAFRALLQKTVERHARRLPVAPAPRERR